MSDQIKLYQHIGYLCVSNEGMRALYPSATVYVMHVDHLAEIASRDTRIAELEKELSACATAVENCEVFRAEIDTANDLLALSVRCVEVRDARIAELERSLSVIKASCPDHCEVLGSAAGTVQNYIVELEQGLAAIKGQEPVAEIMWTERNPSWKLTMFCEPNTGAGVAMKLYAAPVAKQVVMPERKDEHVLYDDAHHEAKGFNDALEQVARLNAADHAEGCQDE